MREFAILLGQRVRRDRVTVGVWAVAIALCAWGSSVAVGEQYNTDEVRAETLKLAVVSRAVLLFRGTPDGAALGPFIAFELLSWIGFMVALALVMLAVRNTRGDEEYGRTELLAATPAGRIMPLAATLVHGALASTLIGGLTAAGLIAAALPAGGSLLIGAAFALLGLVFVALGLLTAQVFRTARAATGAGVTLVIAAYVLRGIGDAGATFSDDLLHATPAWPSWASPLGWVQLMRPYTAADGWPLLWLGLLALAAGAASFAIETRRDLGASLLAEAKGRVTAGPTLGSSFGLAWRLGRGAMLAWAAGGVATGLLAGSMGGLVQAMSDSGDGMGGAGPALERLTQTFGGATLEQAFIAVFYGMVGVLAACCAVQVGLHARSDETRGTLEMLLATPVPRTRWLLDQWLMAALTVIVVVVASGAAGLVGVAGADDPREFTRMVVQSSLSQIPVALIFAGVAITAFALVPPVASALSWSVVSIAAVLGVFGPLLGASDEVTRLSPFSHTPPPGATTGDVWGPVAVMLAVSVVLLAASLVGMSRRELRP